jgi:hypothetical protein
MEITPVTSECLSAVGYDPASQTLRLQFNSGATHDYDGVAPEQYEALMASDSLGKHFQRHIRAQFSQRKVA